MVANLSIWEAKSVDNDILEWTHWTLHNLQATRNKQLNKTQIYNTHSREATARFSNYKQVNLEENESEIHWSVRMSFDNLDINVVMQNFGQSL